MAVRFQPTPNPDAGKFVVEGGLPDAGRRTYASAAEAAEDPLAAALFAVAGVRSVFMVGDFVTVTKHADASWETLRPRVEGAIEDALASG